MSDKEDKQEIAQLERVSAELTYSLERCRLMLADCRTRLAANSNEEPDEVRDDASERG